MWQLKEVANGKTREENKQALKTALEGLIPKIPAIVSLEVGLKCADSPANNDDVVLVSEFKTWADLDTYASHPEHLKVVEFVKSVVEKRAAVDYVF
jgi:hypothetical protein